MAGRLLNRHIHRRAAGTYIGRGSPWGNPYRVGVNAESREDAIRQYAINVLPWLDLTPLLGVDLICSCTPKPCHGEPILWRLYRGL